MASRSQLKFARSFRTALRQSSCSPKSLVAEMAEVNESEACSSSFWNASSESSGTNVCASSRVNRKAVSVLVIEERILSISLELMRATSSEVVAGIALNRSRALVMAPVQPALERFTAARSAGTLLLVVMALVEEEDVAEDQVITSGTRCGPTTDSDEPVRG